MQPERSPTSRPPVTRLPVTRLPGAAALIRAENAGQLASVPPRPVEMPGPLCPPCSGECGQGRRCPQRAVQGAGLGRMSSHYEQMNRRHRRPGQRAVLILALLSLCAAVALAIIHHS